MKSWLIIVAILFAIAEAILWVKNFILPLPVYILGGAFLAIASNYDKGIMAFIKPYIKTNDIISQTASLIEDTPVLQEATKAQAAIEPKTE